MYTAYCSDSRRALDHFNGGIFEEAKPQLEDDCILPALHDLVEYQNPSAPSYRLPHSSERSPYSSIGRIAPTELSFHKAVDPNPQADTESCHTALQLVSVESSVGQAEGFDTDKFAKPALHLDADLSASHNFLPSSNLDLFFPGGSPKQGGAADMSPSKSSDTPETEAPPTAKATIETARSKSASKPLGPADRKALAKQRYREKNRKAQARHRERNKKTIEDLSAKNSSLIAEVANLKLELAIVSQLAKAKDSTLSRMRRVKRDLKYTEAMELIRESYSLVHGEANGRENLEGWSMKDSAAGRRTVIEKLASAVSQGVLSDCNSREAQELQMQAMRKRRLSLEFSVGNPRFVRALYAFERAFSLRTQKPCFEDLWNLAMDRLHFSAEQTGQILAARATMLNRARTIFNERQNIISAVEAGVSEGVADLLASSLEEERQTAFHFLFSFFDEILTLPQDIICDVTVFPWVPDAVALCDLVVERAIAVAPNGVEGLELPSHLITMSNGQLDFNSIATPVKQQLAELSRNASVAGIAASLSLTWPPETPLQLLSVPVTSSHCCTAGISLLRNVMMLAEGAYPCDLPAVPLETLFQIPLLSFFKQRAT